MPARQTLSPSCECAFIQPAPHCRVSSAAGSRRGGNRGGSRARGTLVEAAEQGALLKTEGSFHRQTSRPSAGRFAPSAGLASRARLAAPAPAPHYRVSLSCTSCCSLVCGSACLQVSASTNSAYHHQQTEKETCYLSVVPPESISQHTWTD